MALIVMAFLNLILILGIASFVRKMADVILEIKEQLDEIHTTIVPNDLVKPSTDDSGLVDLE